MSWRGSTQLGLTPVWPPIDRLRESSPSSTVPGVENDALAAVLQSLDARLTDLASAVSELSQQRAHGNASGELDDSSDTAPVAPPRAELPPLTECEDPERYYARVKVGKQLNLPARELDIFATYGGRGLYRDRKGFELLHQLPFDTKRRVVEDALAEDPKEAASMGADLLKYRGEHDIPDF